MRIPQSAFQSHRPGAWPTVLASLAALGLIVFAPMPLAGQAFGGAVLAADGWLLVGEAAHEREPGSVRVYDYDGEWSEVATLNAPEPAVRDGFGSALARAGDFLFVGADGTDGGMVYVYRLEDVPGEDVRPLQTLADPALSDMGETLLASGTELMTAARNQDGEGVLATFRLGEDGRWAPGGTVGVPADAGGLGTQGFDLAEDLLIVGDPDAGTVQVFERGSGPVAWEATEVVDLPDSENPGGRPFGTSVALFQDEILVGRTEIALDEDGGISVEGIVHRFARVDGAWTAVGTLQPEDDAERQGFGMSLAVDGPSLLVGALGRIFVYGRGSDDAGAPAAPFELQGAVELFDEGDGGVITVSRQILAFGSDIAAFGNPAADFGLGSVSVVTREAGDWVRSGTLTVDHAPLPAINGGEISCDDGTASGYDCNRVDLLSFLPREEMGASRGARLNDVWGWTDPLTGREFALVGRMDGTSFVDVTDPYNPRYLGNLARTEGSPPSTWRDIKVFRDYAYIVADGAGEHGMQVFDLAQLRDVTEPQEFEATAMYTGIASSHNIAINEETGFAYLVGSSDGGETCGGGSHMIDINDPLNPVFAGCFAHPNTGRRNTGNSHDAQCVIYHGPDEDYIGREICVNSNETAVSIADVTDKDNPVAVAAADYPNVAYAHQGWLTEDHRYFYSNDELDEVGGLVDATRTLIWDLQDLDDPLLLTEYMNPTKATDHNLYVRGDRLYMSNNRAGLRVLDISDPENPFEIGHFDTTPWSADEAGFDGTWSVYPYFESGTVLLSSRREGLFIVRPRARRLIP
ncbi:MAG: choice-of-anchor B family protein [Gemmatimonadetes bacterium]|nr:choice-of-anchor B family protein [Gemmatimonadota bacterium]